MTSASVTPSPRKTELLEAAYRYILDHGIADMSLRPLAQAIGSSTRVLLFLFGTKDGLVRALLARAREDELAGILHLDVGGGLGEAVEVLWAWLSTPEHAPVLRLWVESYGRSLLDAEGPWSGFARESVTDWLRILERAQPGVGAEADAQRTLALAVLRGALLDLAATSDRDRLDRAVAAAAARFRADQVA
ncbi:TetR family transcriptional regulator [Herbiconiux sp. KACC 21604]|uniref:TetR/AcrR family transcriptional regulator n=1 Tax=unclassified Herbiconiux TaxID=2618217 RepID=UPI0014930AC3|nr:TetR family transcriptional regulator [Herbiconiux sp. SALV-R1]QJU55089.1 TetR/AcrR family transcriptional regulator [Herbiconiux sp. SALV-R1]WPO86235.1 TetR family transcriptional regulator [Herbiconiux sp. KACC 21604]